MLVPLVTAGLAAILALAANKYLDRKKASRDLSNTIAESLRDDIREAVEVASLYWSYPDRDKLINESKIKLLEHEIRSASLLIDADRSVKSAEFTSAVNAFLQLLTGADFEARAVEPNQPHVREIVGRGVMLRKVVSEVRRELTKK